MEWLAEDGCRFDSAQEKRGSGHANVGDGSSRGTNGGGAAGRPAPNSSRSHPSPCV
jgi:hypothetical protein